MKERPILFSAPMVRAILEGRKTVTRRVVKPQPEMREVAGVASMLSFKTRHGSGWWLWPNARDQVLAECPYGQPGDLLWVRETHSLHQTHGQHRGDDKRWGPWGGLPTKVSPDGTQIAYYREGFDRCDGGRWRPSIHMPRWASRITLEVTSVRVERLQDITEDDAAREGCMPMVEPDGSVTCGRRKLAFRDLWESINGADSYVANPWVWVVEFKRLEQPHA